MCAVPNHFHRAMAASVLVALCSTSPHLLAQTAEHVVSSADLQSATVASSQTREQNVAALSGFLSSEQAQSAFKSAHINPMQVKAAVAGLSDAELAQLASKASRAQTDFAAGNMSNRDLLIILVGLAALILIIVAVH